MIDSGVSSVCIRHIFFYGVLWNFYYGVSTVGFAICVIVSLDYEVIIHRLMACLEFELLSEVQLLVCFWSTLDLLQPHLFFRNVLFLILCQMQLMSPASFFINVAPCSS